jgi:hypothetical protein
MHRDDYSLIANHELRNILRNVCNDPRDLPGRKDLRAQLVAALPDAKPDVVEALMVKAEEFARTAVDPGARWDLRSSADALTLHVLKTYEAADRLVPAEDVEPVDVSAVMDSIDNWDPAERNTRALQRAAKDSELEANRIRQLGGQS